MLGHRPTQPPTNDSDFDNEPRPTPPQSPAGNMPNPPNGNWLRTYPTEPPIDINSDFVPRHTGPKNIPPRNSLPLQYFILFFTDIIWNLWVKETND
ncbi:hypothetical protein J6590_039790 [Homalodisca vitripennis]|nr:hypothetical protein J6590_039790 [Homalodisca vitripennis]